MEIRRLNPGETLLISTGEYSDYSVAGAFKVLIPFSPSDVLASYIEQNPKEREEYGFEFTKFTHYMVTQSYLEEIPSVELHLGDYGTADLSLSAEDA